MRSRPSSYSQLKTTVCRPSTCQRVSSTGMVYWRVLTPPAWGLLTRASTARRAGLAAAADAVEVEGGVVARAHRLDQHRHPLVVDVGGAAAGAAAWGLLTRA